MTTVQDNIRLVMVASRKVQAHCMYMREVMDRETLTVYFPEGYSVGGVRVSLSNGKTWAYEKALAKMEEVWSEDLVALKG